jgi:hypothetical protein
MCPGTRYLPRVGRPLFAIHFALIVTAPRPFIIMILVLIKAFLVLFIIISRFLHRLRLVFIVSLLMLCILSWRHHLFKDLSSKIQKTLCSCWPSSRFRRFRLSVFYFAQG